MLLAAEVMEQSRILCTREILWLVCNTQRPCAVFVAAMAVNQAYRAVPVAERSLMMLVMHSTTHSFVCFNNQCSDSFSLCLACCRFRLQCRLPLGQYCDDCHGQENQRVAI